MDDSNDTTLERDLVAVTQLQVGLLQFPTCQQALGWYIHPYQISQWDGRHCDFYLGNVGKGRIDTDILNRQQGQLN